MSIFSFTRLVTCIDTFFFDFFCSCRGHCFAMSSLYGCISMVCMFAQHKYTFAFCCTPFLVNVQKLLETCGRRYPIYPYDNIGLLNLLLIIPMTTYGLWTWCSESLWTHNVRVFEHAARNYYTPVSFLMCSIVITHRGGTRFQQRLATYSSLPLVSLWQNRLRTGPGHFPYDTYGFEHVSWCVPMTTGCGAIELT